MKNFILLIALAVAASVCRAQDFNKAMATAKASYSAGKLEDAHFALQQAMQEVDLTVGREVLKLLPSKLGTMTSVSKDDNVSSNVGFVGATIHRAYGQGAQNADISIIFKVNDCTDDQILALADTVPLQEIAKLIE